ncbi:MULTISPECIES: hypothetical protein [Cohnella]|uniref:hypothetical protein n=1 Tax=Cohnella TaxID=329857 RepID=UPI001594A0AA|nr:MULTISPECIES: hypothetical protein [Cohnella]MBN2983799.1 hypothetical protein [Cohnella algarum]
MKFFRGRKFLAAFTLAIALSAVTAGAASALPRQTASTYYQCSGWGECLEFAYWHAFLR